MQHYISKSTYHVIYKQSAYRIMKVVLLDFPGPFHVHFSRTFHDRLCPFSMSFQYSLMEWISNKSDCHRHMYI